MTTRSCAAGYPVGGLAVGVVLRAGRATAGSRIASDLANLIIVSEITSCIYASELRHSPCTDRTPARCAWRTQASSSHRRLAQHSQTTCPPLRGQAPHRLRGRRPGACWTLASSARDAHFEAVQRDGNFRGQCRERVQDCCATLAVQPSSSFDLRASFSSIHVTSPRTRCLERAGERIAQWRAGHGLRMPQRSGLRWPMRVEFVSS